MEAKNGDPAPGAKASEEPGAKASEDAGSRKDREEWSEGAICALLDSYTEKYTELNGKGLKSKDWDEVVSSVNSRNGGKKSAKTIEHCRNKMDTLTKRFKSERKNKPAGVPSQWIWYHKMEVIRGYSGKDPAPKIRRNPVFEPPPPITSPVIIPSSSFPADHRVHIPPLGCKAPLGDHHHVKVPQEERIDPQGIDPQGALAIARSISEFASSLHTLTSGLCSSLREFGQVFTKVEMAKMEALKDLELKRMQMQLDCQVTLARTLRSSRKRKRDSSSSSETE